MVRSVVEPMSDHIASAILLTISVLLAVVYGLGLLIVNPPACWEDEVIVMVVHDPYETSPGLGTLGCVPADNLPVNGFRP